MSFNSSISPLPPSRKDNDSAQTGAHIPAPVFRDQPKSSDTATRPPTISKSSESSDVGLPGGYPRDPHGALDRMSDKAGATHPSSESGGTFMDAAREDVRHVVNVAASYLPESVVGVFGSVFPADVTATEDVEKKLDPGQASQMGLASSGTSSSLNPSDFAVAGIASEMKFPSRDSAAISNPSDAPSKSAINPKFDPKSGTDAQAKGPLSEDLSKTYAPTNFASASSVDKPSIPPDSVPPPGSKSEDLVGKSRDDGEEKPAFVSYAPAPIITEEYQPSYDEDDTPSATKQFTSPGVASALGSTAPPSKEQASDQTETTGAKAATGACELPAKAKDQKNNNAQTDSTFPAAPVATDFGSSRVAPATKDTPTSSRPSGKETRVPGQAASELGPRPSSNAVQNVDESKEAPIEDKRRKAIEATALGAGIGTLGGAYMTSRAPAKDSSIPASQGPTGVSSTQPSNDAPKATSGTTTPAISAPISRDVEGATAASLPDDRKAPQATGREAGASALVTGGLAADASDKKAEKDAAKEAKQAEKTHHQREKQAAEATAAAEAAHKKVQKEAKEREEEEKRRVKEAQKEQQKTEKEAAAAEAARKKAQKDAKEKEEKEQRKKEKEAEEREEEVKSYEKDVGAAALVSDKQADNRALDQPKQDSKNEKGEQSEQSGKHTGVKALAAGLVPAGLVGASAAEKERGRKAGSSSEVAQPHSATKSESENAPKPGGGAPGSNSKAARPGPTALGGTRSDSHEAAKEGADSDFPLPSPSREAGGFMARKEAVDLDGKGNGARGSAEKAEKVQGSTDDVNANHGSRYRGTEGLQEKHDGGALASSTVSRQEKEHGKSDDKTSAGKSGHDHGDSEDGKKEGFVKHMVEKVKDKLHHHH